MSAEGKGAVPRVVIGDFGAIARLGLREFLEQEGVEVVAEERTGTQELRELLTELRPDVVVVDLDDDGGLTLASEIAGSYPAVKVIACSSQEPLMRIFPPFHHGESYEAELSPGLLADAVRS